MKEKITILVVDDHAVVRQGVAAFLATQPDFLVVAEAESGIEAVEQAGLHAPDVVLMDLIMPGMDGVEATRRVKHISPRSQIVILTSYHDDAHIFPAIRAGALSYVLKDIKMEELVATVRRATIGEASLHPRVAARVVQEVRGNRVENINPFTELTEREMDTLQLVAQGLNNAQIAQRLVISPNTVKGYVSNVLNKLHLADRTQAAVYAWREGIVRSK